jgi:hypothetical protein
MNKNY